MTLRRLAVVLAVLVLVTPCASSAALLFNYSGTVRNVTLVGGATDDLGLSIGAEIGGSFIFRPIGPDERSSPLDAFFPNSVFTMSFGAFSPERSQFQYSYFALNADPLFDYVNAYLVADYGPDPATGAVNVSDLFSFFLDEPSARAVLGSDSYDLTKLNLADFDIAGPQADSRFTFVRVWHMPDGDLLPQTHVILDLERLRVHEIPLPEPNVLALLAVGLAGLAFSIRRRGRGM